MRSMGYWSRSLAGGMALWFGLVMAAPAILHSCPKAMASAAAAGAGDEHAVHGAHHPDHQNQDAPADCQCLGSCALASVAAIPSPTIADVAVSPPSSHHGEPIAAEAAAVPHPDHLNPFSTAPPAHLG
ncbi:MAG TPA: hypothetical protein P5319_08685 [Gemmatimonadales bacterium]|nr:hypothetical protein [Gemmatimonadales bacterium]